MSHSGDGQVQRALIMQGGGALGAYEAGVFKTLSTLLPKIDKENGVQRKNLFDIVAGTSAGAINACLIVNHVRNKGWEGADSMLCEFWRDTATPTMTSLWPKSELASETWSYWEKLRDWQTETSAKIAQSAFFQPFSKLREEPFFLPLYFLWPDTLGPLASEEATRRYRSWALFAFAPLGTPNVLSPAIYQPDFAYFNPSGYLLRYSNAPLVQTIKKYWDFERQPIKTFYAKDEPRLLFVAVDIMDSTTATFDSYYKADRSWKTEYIHLLPDGGTEQHTIEYKDGITIDQLLASMSSHLRHRPPSLTATTTIITTPKKHGKTKEEESKKTYKETRYFWDGFYLSNTPLREVIQAHRDYWLKVEGMSSPPAKGLEGTAMADYYKGATTTVPPLEIFIVNLYPTLEKEDYPKDPDGISNRVGDILYHDRTEYDEKAAVMVSDYVKLAKKLIEIALDDSKNLATTIKKINELGAKDIGSEGRGGKPRTYETLLAGRFDIERVVRIEMSADARNDIYGKAFEFSTESIENLISAGSRDAAKYVAD